MSDSDDALPSEGAIFQTLRDVVIATHKSGKDEDLTVKRVRARAERELGLKDGFFKTHEAWNQKSGKAIREAVVSTHTCNRVYKSDMLHRTSTARMNLRPSQPRRRPPRSRNQSPSRRRRTHQVTALAA